MRSWSRKGWGAAGSRSALLNILDALCRFHLSVEEVSGYQLGKRKAIAEFIRAQRRAHHWKVSRINYGYKQRKFWNYHKVMLASFCTVFLFGKTNKFLSLAVFYRHFMRCNKIGPFTPQGKS